MATPATKMLCLPICLIVVSSLPAQDATARQRAAIEAACRNGVLTAAECRQKLAALKGGDTGSGTGAGNEANVPAMARSIAGATTYRHPQGLYSISVPPGWQVDTSQANPKLTHGDTWMIVETSASNSQPKQVAQRDASQMQPMLQNYEVTDQGDFMTRLSHRASGLTANATVATRSGPQPKTFVFWTQTDGQQHFVTFTGSMNQQEAAQTIPVLMQVFNSLKFANE